MLAIPAIDLIDGSCVRLYKGDYGKKTTYSDDPVGQALRFQSAGFQRVHLIDLEGAKEGGGRNREAMRRVISACRVPVQVGGGIRTREDVEELLEFGASYLILGTVAVEDPSLLDDWVGRFGGDPFILSLDLRQGRIQTEGWREESALDIGEFLRRMEGWGIPQLITTDVERDGTLGQPGFSSYPALIDQLPEGVQLIAAGGISAPEHLRQLRDLGVDAAIVGRALYEGEYSWEEMLNAC